MWRLKIYDLISVSNGNAPFGIKIAAGVLGLLFVFLLFVLLFRLTWNNELNETVFGFIGMYAILALTILKFAGGKSDQANSNVNSGILNSGDNSKLQVEQLRPGLPGNIEKSERMSVSQQKK